jgi:hypothetical protein
MKAWAFAAIATSMSFRRRFFELMLDSKLLGVEIHDIPAEA